MEIRLILYLIVGVEKGVTLTCSARQSPVPFRRTGIAKRFIGCRSCRLERWRLLHQYYYYNLRAMGREKIGSIEGAQVYNFSCFESKNRNSGEIDHRPSEFSVIPGVDN